ncbi:hypothetical protein LINGRAHAP2_LOCUS3061 [Linum grandiflorum]
MLRSNQVSLRGQSAEREINIFRNIQRSGKCDDDKYEPRFVGLVWSSADERYNVVSTIAVVFV